MILYLAPPLSFSQSDPAASSKSKHTPDKGAEYLKENKPELAVPEFRAIIALDPNNVDARGNLGAVLFFQGTMRMRFHSSGRR